MSRDDKAARMQELDEIAARAEAERDAAADRLYAIEDEHEEGESAEQEAEIEARREVAEAEYERLSEIADEAHDAHTAVFWEEDDEDEDDEDSSERLPLTEAKDIWLSSGMDEDYTMGYSEEELRREAEDD